MQFTLGPPQAAPPQPPGYPAAPAPARPPAPPPPDSELEEIGRAAVEEREPDEYLPTRGTNKAQVFILAGIAAVLMAGTVIAGLYLVLFRHRGGDPGGPEAGVQMPDLNVAVEGAPPGWLRDDNVRSKIGPPYIISYRREGPEAYVAFGATEPEKGRMPRPSEMRRDMMTPFPKLFDTSTLERQPPAAADWLGEAVSTHEAHPSGFTFRAQSTDGVIWRGETYTVANKGVAYFWLAWCPENDYEGLKGDFAAFRANCKLLNLRDDWRETRSSVNDFKGDSVPYTLSDAEGLWREVPAADLAELKKAEPDLDKRLRMSLTPRRDRKARPEYAELSVYLLTTADADPPRAAKQFAEELETNRIKQANSDFKPPEFAELTDPPQGDPTPPGAPAPATAVRLLSSVKESPSANRLIVASAVKSGGKTVVVVCWCEAAKRDLFETKFVQIASSLRE
jgi:hypothetical protein